MIDRFCVVFRVLFAFDVKLRNLNYSLFKAYSLTISTNTKKNSLIQFGDKIPAVISVLVPFIDRVPNDRPFHKCNKWMRP